MADLSTIVTSVSAAAGTVAVTFVGAKVAAMLRGERAKTDVETGHALRDDLVREIGRLKADILSEETQRREETSALEQEVALCEARRVTLVQRIEALEAQIGELLRTAAIAGERAHVQTSQAATADAVNLAHAAGVQEGLATPARPKEATP